MIEDQQKVALAKMREPFPAREEVMFIDLGTVKMSTDTKELFMALSKAQAAYETVKKENSVDMGTGRARYKYADLADVQEALKRPFADNGLSHTQWLNASGITTVIQHQSGQWISGTLQDTRITMRGTGPQDYGSFTTYLRRYHLAAAAGVSQEDDDGAAAQSKSGKGAASDEKGAGTGKASVGKQGATAPAGPGRAAPVGKPGNEQPPAKANDKPKITSSLSEAQVRRLFGIKKTMNWPDESLYEACRLAFGFSIEGELSWPAFVPTIMATPMTSPQYSDLTKFMEMGLSPEEVVEKLLLQRAP